MKTLLSFFYSHTQVARTCILLLLTFAAISAGCTPAAPPLIKIGLIAPFSGPYREVGYQAIYGARLAITEHNLTLLKPNYHVELIALDDKADTATATEQAEKLISDPNVVGVIGHWLEHTTAATTTIFSGAKVPMLATATVPNEAIHGSRYLFRLYPNNDILLHQLLTTARKHEVEHTCNCGLISGSAMLNSIQHASTGATAVGGPLWSLEDFITLAGATAEGSFFITPAPHPLVSPRASEFADRHVQEYPGQKVGWVSVHAYEATRILLHALQKSTNPTATHLVSSLASTDYPDGLLGPVRFTVNGQWEAPNYHVYKWVDGVRSLVDH